MSQVELTSNPSASIADQLRMEIITGRIEEGAALREVSLAERFEVSRAPIREALKQLAHEGMVESKPNCGMRVAPSSSKSMQELVIPLRQTVESFALRSIFDDLNDDDFAEWEVLLTEMKAACENQNFLQLTELDIKFHQSIVARSPEQGLMTIWLTLVSRLRRHFLEGFQKPNDPMKVYYEHLAIVSMFRSGKLEPSIQALISNID
ncbi:MAG: exonuclease [Gimesia sp.]|uniref:Putative HTH-type transcriptional regulator YdfH n=1 Tax=Gimesia chilikensis TaxID=2605989 RepID=A0A517PK78_9PLAN|nr:GntR family transcriptional regulator [Gimesia chilikensis]MBN70370.1 exonuclease [Gimesia sp.]QDT19767.1 putative HTH-type transcriptional regulator YdfH [Gimesia chilikensis]